MAHTVERQDLDDTIVMVVGQMGWIQSSKQLHGVVCALGADVFHTDVVVAIWRLVDTGRLCLDRGLHLVPAPLGGGPVGWG
jgi:hypothetical protein